MRFFHFWSSHGGSTKAFGGRLAYLFSWYYRHTYMSWYIDMYMIYIRTVLVFLNIDVLRCDAGRLFGFYVAGVAAFVRVK